ncbi:tyrosine-type recombinase/integrase [Streptococcus sp. Marseille-P6264]|uniref:tyrosine-type recombinase/integrase n=1 Tax=Streptococcus sp. Marseille-P6264 TaxID=2487315 RepID=UPI00292A4353|nr:tyrosine-type recombinase/integrase [Streptococcus sp. Marseille-P6264]
MKRHRSNSRTNDDSISTHIFRHTHISFLAEQGIPLEAIQDRVGHTRGSRGTDIYLYLTQKNKRSHYSCIRFVN